MNKTLIIGASGQIGHMVTTALAETDQPVRALVRDKTKLEPIAGSQLEIMEADLEGDFSAAFEGMSNVIFCAGSGGATGADKTLLIDLWAAKKAIDYAKKQSVKKFVMVSSMGADDPDAIGGDIKPYLVAKHMADQYLMESGVPYTLVRPGPLTNDEGQGKITIKRPAHVDEMSISREDVAKSLLFILTKEGLDSKIFELFNGTYEVENVLV